MKNIDFLAARASTSASAYTQRPLPRRTLGLRSAKNNRKSKIGNRKSEIILCLKPKFPVHNAAR